MLNLVIGKLLGVLHINSHMVKSDRWGHIQWGCVVTMLSVWIVNQFIYSVVVFLV